MSARRTARTDALIRPAASIVPSGSIAGRSLVAVVVIMTFLSALTAGAVQLLASAASTWGDQVSREITIQLRPGEGVDSAKDIERTPTIVSGFEGIAGAEAMTTEDTERLLEPWLGQGLDLKDLAIPRLVLVRLASGVTPDLEALRKRLAEDVPNASLDDHRFWVDRLAAMARTLVLAGLAILALMITATALSVVFATRGAMDGNRAVVEVLHFIGAPDGFIAEQFQRHFVRLGLKGGILGGLLASLAFFGARFLTTRFNGSAASSQVELLFGSFAMDWRGYSAVLVTVLLVSLITGLTSRFTVHHVLRGQL